jgi:hypothetical protein
MPVVETTGGRAWNSKHFLALCADVQQNGGITEDLEGRGYGIIDVLSQNLSGESKKN